jgi:putative tryptophan/tyrosine transport system substrate-binding protein
MAHWWQMRRREFITLVGGVAATWPLAARAQQPAMPVIGFLHSSSPEPNANRVSAFRKGLAETGYVEGQNLAIEFRWAEGQDDRLPDLAADLIRRRVAVIATPASTPASLAAQAATTSIPIVFAPKQLGMLRELAPGANRFVVLVSRNSAFTDTVVKDLQASASVIGVPIDIFRVGTGREIDAAFANLVQKPGGALLVVPDPFFTNRRAQIVTLAARHALPAIYCAPEFAEIGGLMSYGPNVADGYRQAGIYVGRILKGEKPADLPVVQPTKFELVVNLNTARALGITIPNTLLALADEVIE